MAVSYMTSWTFQEEREIAPGRPICDTDHGLMDLHKRLARSMMYTYRCIAQGGVGPLGKGKVHLEAGVSSLQRRYYGVAHFWRSPTRMRLTVYGQNCDVAIYVGGSLMATVKCGATANFYSSGYINHPITISSGVGVVEVKAKQNATSGTREWTWWCLHEAAMTAPPVDSDTYTEFVGTDQAACAADTPLDGFALLRLATNCAAVLKERTRGTAQFYPSGEQHEVSSAWWRSDGPYTLEAEPWVESASIALCCEAIDIDVDVTVFSEWEDSYTAIERAQTLTAGAGLTTLTFTGVKTRASESSFTENRFWIGFRCGVGSSVGYSPVTVLEWKTTGKRPVRIVDAGSGLPTTEPIDWPVGRLFRGSEDQLGFASGDKTGLSQVPQFAAFDLAANLTRKTTVGFYDCGEILLAANNNKANKIENLTDGIRVYEVGVLALNSISLVGANNSALSNAQKWAAASVGKPPPWSVVADVAAKANLLTRFGTIQYGIRNRGQRLTSGYRLSGSVYYHQRGRYNFIPTPSLDHFIDQWVIPQPLVYGSDRNSVQLRAKVIYFIVDAGTGAGEETTVTWELREQGVGNLGSSEVTEQIYSATEEQESVTLWDAAMSAVSSGVDPAIPPIEVYEHNYIQQCGWLGEEFQGSGHKFGRKLWSSAFVLGDLPSATPCFVELVGTCAASHAWIVVVGCSLDVLERK